MSDPLTILVVSGAVLMAGVIGGVLICEAAKNHADRIKARREEEERERELDQRLCDGLDPHLTQYIRELNEQHSAARVVPLRRAS